MGITQQQQDSIVAHYELGLPDGQVARLAGVSLATVKRYRQRLGLPTRDVKARRGRFGERVVLERAQALGLAVEWRGHATAPYDLRIEGRRVDVKAASRGRNGGWRFRLGGVRSSFHSRYRYRKDYAADCEVVALVCLQGEDEPVAVYLLESGTVPSNVQIYEGGEWEAHREAWETALPRQWPLAA